jgi:hypothetical protein
MAGHGWRRLATIWICCIALLALGLPAGGAAEIHGVDSKSAARADGGEWTAAQRRGPNPGDGSISYHQGGISCWDDPTGDTWRVHDQQFEEFPRADITRSCAVLDDGISVAVELAVGTDPLTDDNWRSRLTYVDWYFDTNNDGRADFSVELRLDEQGQLWAPWFVRNAQDGYDRDSSCDGTPFYEDRLYLVGVESHCFGNAEQIWVRAFMDYDSDRHESSHDAAPVYRDVAPDSGFAGPVIESSDPDDGGGGGGGGGGQEPDCSSAFLLGDARPDAVDVLRVNAGSGQTVPVQQAVAVSRAVWCSQSAGWVVLARADLFPDALAGSSLAFGGPVLFTHSPTSAPPGTDPNRLAEQTRAEIQRVLQPGRDLPVFILGGASALSSGLEDELTAMGYQPVRLQGGAREDTAAAVGLEARRLYKAFSVLDPNAFPDLGGLLIATRANWPDAVAAGALGSYWGMPVLLTSRDSLHPATRQAIHEVLPRLIYVVGGTGVISPEVRQQAQEAGRARQQDLMGPTRTETALEVSREQRRLIADEQRARRVDVDVRPDLSVAVSMTREPDGYAHVLSAATAMGLFPSVILPVSGQDQHASADVITASTRAFICTLLTRDGHKIDLVVAGDTDLLASSVDGRFQDLLNREGC